jgi:hypothetical protein
VTKKREVGAETRIVLVRNTEVEMKPQLLSEMTQRELQIDMRGLTKRILIGTRIRRKKIKRIKIRRRKRRKIKSI